MEQPAIAESLLALALFAGSLALFWRRASIIVQQILKARPEAGWALRPLGPRLRRFVWEVALQGKVIKERPLPGIPVVSNIAYLGMYPDATLSALAIGAIIELIPLAVIVIGMSMMERANMPRVPSQPSPVAPSAIAVQPKRQYKRRTPKSGA